LYESNWYFSHFWKVKMKCFFFLNLNSSSFDFSAATNQNSFSWNGWLINRGNTLKDLKNMIKHKLKIIITHKLMQTSSEVWNSKEIKFQCKKKKTIGGWIMPCTMFTDRTNSNSGLCFIYLFSFRPRRNSVLVSFQASSQSLCFQ